MALLSKDQAKLHCALLSCTTKKKPQFTPVCVAMGAQKSATYCERSSHFPQHSCVTCTASCSLSQHVSVRGLSMRKHKSVTAHVSSCAQRQWHPLNVHTLMIKGRLTASVPPVEQLTDAVLPAAVEVSHHQQRTFPRAQAVVCLMLLEPVQHTSYLRHAVTWPVRGAL